MRVDVEIDAEEALAFLRSRPDVLKQRLETFYLRVGEQVASIQKVEASDRLGVETAQSRMQTVDPMRPKGHYLGSIQANVFGDRVEIGPNRIYGRWVELGSESPGASPGQQKADFIGHRIVARSAEQAEEPIRLTLQQIVQEALNA